MKKVLCMLVMVSFLVCGASAVAADKIAFVNIKKILFESEAGKEAAQNLKKYVDSKKAQIQEKETELEKLKSHLEKQRSILTEAAYREKELSYQKKFRDYKRFIEDANDEMKLRDQQVTQGLIPNIQKVINDIGKKEGHSAIFDIGTSGLFYNSAQNDITDRVIDQFNKSYRSSKK